MKYKVGDWVEIDNPSVYSRNPDVIIRGVITGGYDRKDSSNLYFIDCIAVNGRLHVIHFYQSKRLKNCSDVLI